MCRDFISCFIIVLMLLSCNNTKKVDVTPSFSGAEGEVKLAVLAPGHFHASLLQKNSIPQLNDTVYLFAPESVEIDQYIENVQSFNNREADPTNWNLILYKGDDYLKKFSEDKNVNVVVLAGNNRNKTEYILTAVNSGKNVISDKPMAINSKDFLLLETAYKNADSLGLYIYDLMTERYDLLNIIEKELINDLEFFGGLQKGTREVPAVFMKSIHHFYKEVSGVPLKRPQWYYDVEQQGEGISDVTTHLIDQLFWKCFPEESINRNNDIGEINALHWPTEISLDKYSLSTGAEYFPEYLQENIEENILKVNANGIIEFDVKGHYVKFEVLWNFQAPEGGGDTFNSFVKGNKAIIKTVQDSKQNYIKQLYVLKPEGIESKVFAENIQRAIENIQTKYDFVSYSKTSNYDEYMIDIPVQFRDGHESHFSYVVEKFFDFLVKKDMPEWEKINTLTKYFITTKAVEVANE